MPLFASEIVQQDEILKRVQKLQEFFANDPEVIRIDHRLAEDWSGDPSLFVEVFLSTKKPLTQAVLRLSEQIDAALLRIVRSEELGLHSYVNFVSKSENGQ